MASDEEDIIFIGESKIADLGTENVDFEDKNVVQEAKSVMRKTSKEVFMHIKERIKIGADDAKTTKSIQSCSSGVKPPDKSFNERKHTCIMCGEVFANFTDIKVHLFQAHSYQKRSQCDICGEFFSDQKQLEIHKQTHINSALLSESNRHHIDVTKASVVESVQEKPPAKEIHSGSINKVNTDGIEYLNKRAENGTDVYKSKVKDNTSTKKTLFLPMDKIYVCKICNQLVCKSYAQRHEKIHSSKNACSQSSSSVRDKIFGSQQVHYLVNNNIGNSAKGMTPDEGVIKVTYKKNSDDNITMGHPHAINMESSLLHAKTFDTVSVNHDNPEKTSSLTKRSEGMSMVFVTSHNNTTLLNNNLNGIVTSAHLNIREASQTKSILHAIPLQSTSNLPVLTNVVASTGQKIVLPISCSQSNVALSVPDGSLYKPTSVVAILKGNVAHISPVVSMTNASLSFVALPNGIFSASQMATGTNHSFIHLDTQSGNTATVPEAKLSIPLASHSALANGDVSTQAETVVRANTNVFNLPSTEVEKVPKQHGNIKSTNSLTNRKIYSCPICKKGLSKKYVMKHMSRMHQGEKPFKCEICPKTFCKKLSLTKHIALKHEVITAVANSENENNVFLSQSHNIDSTVKGSNIGDLNSNMKMFEQNVHETALPFFNPTANILGAKADNKNSVGNLEILHNEQSVLGYCESGDKASKSFESVNVETQIINRRICEIDEREEITSCGKKSSLDDMNGLLHNVNVVEGNGQEADIEIIEELEVLSVDMHDRNVGEKQKLADAAHERQKRKFNQSASKCKRICKLCNITFDDRKSYRWHMLRIHSKRVSSKANVQCQQCGKLFLFHTSLKQHLILKHPKN